MEGGQKTPAKLQRNDYKTIIKAKNFIDTLIFLQIPILVYLTQYQEW